MESEKPATIIDVLDRRHTDYSSHPFRREEEAISTAWTDEERCRVAGSMMTMACIERSRIHRPQNRSDQELSLRRESDRERSRIVSLLMNASSRELEAERSKIISEYHRALTVVLQSR